MTTGRFELVAHAAAGQHGVVTRRQLAALGFSGRAVERMLAARALHLVHRGVYAVGHVALSREGRWMAAVLAAGDGAALAGHAAAELWGIGRRPAHRTEVATPRRCDATIAGADVAQMADVARRSTERAGIRVLRPTWIVVGLAPSVARGELVRIVSQAAFRGVLDLDELLAAAHDGTRRRGTVHLRGALRAYLCHGEHGTDSRFEDRAVAWLPQVADPPRHNVVVDTDRGGIRVDVVYERLRVVVEFDGPHHDHLAAALRDRERDDALRRAGWTVVRIRLADFERDPYLATQVARATLQAAARQRSGSASRGSAGGTNGGRRNGDRGSAGDGSGGGGSGDEVRIDHPVGW